MIHIGKYKKYPWWGSLGWIKSVPCNIFKAFLTFIWNVDYLSRTCCLSWMTTAVKNVNYEELNRSPSWIRIVHWVVAWLNNWFLEMLLKLDVPRLLKCFNSIKRFLKFCFSYLATCCWNVFQLDSRWFWNDFFWYANISYVAIIK